MFQKRDTALSLSFETPAAFDLALLRLAAIFRRESGVAEGAALNCFDSFPDWRRLSSSERLAWIERATGQACRELIGIPNKLKKQFEQYIPDIFHSTRGHLKNTHGLQLSVDMSAQDRRLARLVVQAQTNFVRHEYGQRLTGLSAQARRLVAEGLEAGLGRDDLAAALSQTARQALVERSNAYWEVVAGAFIGSGRSSAQMSSYSEAGIHRYVIEAVLDEHTTEICRFLHGKSFLVEDALHRLERAAKLDDPDDIKALQPWVRTGTDAATGRQWLYAGQGDARRPIVEVLRPGLGTRDLRGDYGRHASDRRLADLGVSLPPFHGLCRTTTLPTE